MVKPFTSNYKDFSRVSKPCRLEGSVDDLIVEGEIPPELDGTFYRVSQDPFYDPDYFQEGSKATPFDGDGNVSAFRIKDGRVSWKQRYVQTERLMAEKKAGRSLFGLLSAPFTNHPCVQALMQSPANTNVIIHHGKLLAMHEIGAPYEMDPNTLETIGHEPFPGEIPARRPFTAHPKVDPDTGSLVAFGYNLEGAMDKKFVVFEIDKNGKRAWERSGIAPTNGPFHDMAITPNYVVLVQMPFVLDHSDVYSPGRPDMFYDRHCSAWLMVVPRNNPDKPIRAFKWKNCMNIHTGCSWEEDGCIYFDCTRAHENAFVFIHGPPPEQPKLVVDYVKWKIDPNAESDEVEDPEILIDIPCEFPRTDERFLGKKAKISFLAAFKQSHSAAVLHQGLNVLVRFNQKSRKMDVLDPGNCLVQEPAFVPRSDDAPEGDGYIIVMVDNLDENRNDLSYPPDLFFTSRYNSTFFVSLNNNGYDIYYASSEFPSGAPFELDVFPDPPSDVIDSYDIDGKARANFTFHLPDGTNKSWEMTLDYQTKPAAIQSDAGNLGVSNNGSYFERLNNSDCIRAYAQAILPSRRNLVLVVSNSPRDNPEIRTVPYNIEVNSSMETFYQSCANSSGDPIRTPTMGLVSCSENSSLYAIDSYSNSLAPVVSGYRYVWFSWICSQDDSYPEYNIPGAICSDGAWQSVRDDSSRWSVNGYDVEYCISEVVEDQCRLNVAINLLIVVIVFNAVKVVVITLVIWKIRDRPIVTVGDAAESFIRQPDITTKGMCLLTRADASKQSSKNVQFAYGPVEPKPYKMEKKRRGSAASKARWATAMILTSIALITILGLLGYAIRILKTQYDRGDAKSLVALGLGKASPFTLIRGWALPQTGDGAIVATVLIANLPQLLLSLLYVLLNGLVTSLSLAAEWSRHAHARRALRVSHPRGAQRSTYFLQLPYRLGVPLLACAAGLHWLVSQSIFVAKVDGVDPTGVPQDVGWGSGAVTCGYSPLGIVVTVVAALVLVGFVGVLGARRLRPGMPMAGSCSVAISAACHVPKGTSPLLPVMWGVIPEVEEERDDGVKVGHCAFSNERVEVPIEGRLYA
ncbi:hypothetical protein SLS57_009052 [Botryosphaeria dothidea]